MGRWQRVVGDWESCCPGGVGGTPCCPAHSSHTILTLLPCSHAASLPFIRLRVPPSTFTSPPLQWPDGGGFSKEAMLGLFGLQGFEVFRDVATDTRALLAWRDGCEQRAGGCRSGMAAAAGAGGCWGGLQP